MSIQLALQLNHKRIVDCLHAAIVYGMIDTWKRCSQKGGNPEEPDFVAGLVLESCPLMNHALKYMFLSNGINCSMLAVFCHQTPKVQYSGMKGSSCELGDLLFLHVHTDSAGHVRRNALLYQAKVSSAQPYHVGHSERDQLKLYMYWPDFKYVNSGPLSGQDRHVVPKSAHLGAQYMLIDDRPIGEPESGLLHLPGTYPIGSCVADEYLIDHNHLAEELFEFLTLRAGRVIDDRHTSMSSKGWSCVVWDLLLSSVSKVFNRKKSGRVGSPRFGSDRTLLDGAFFADTTSAFACTTIRDELNFGSDADRLYTSGSDDPPRKNRDNFDESPDASGVSIVLIETSSRSEG